ncbi:MAG: hypothetical protein GYB21_02470 [Oceanospirillales bacterium]|nr:hypothetical protein [Oceanospirillales bacterium]
MGYYSLNPPVSLKLADEKSPLLITDESPYAYRKFVEFFATCFRREFHYDFVPFSASETLGARGFFPYQAYLFHENALDIVKYIDDPPKNRCVGACCFRWVNWVDAPASWSLQWVWFHPYFRQKGFLSSVWSQFREKYGDFHIDRPLSHSMEKFLERAENKT